jgi:Flp pilus assembly protein TadG
MKIVNDLSGQLILLARSLKRGAKARKICASARGRRLWDEHGNMLVEIAIAMPVLLLIFTGIFDFGIAYNNQLTLNQAVGAGAQYLQQIRTSTSDPCADTLTAIENAAPTLTASKISLTLNLNGTPETNKTTCSGAQQYLAEQEPVTVTATYPCSLPIVFTRGSTWVSTCSLTATVTEFEY